MNNTQKKVLIGALVMMGAISYLIYAGIKETSVYYLTVSEASMMNSRPGEDFKMEGKVQSGSIEIAEDSLGAEFVITDSKKTVRIKYSGTLPDMFKDEADVVVQGGFDSSGLFLAHTLLTSCPSRYEASEEEQKT